MDLDFSEEQQMVVDMAKAMLEEQCPTQLVRDMEDDPKGLPDKLWAQMGELGLNGLLIPESYGGGGLGMVEAALVYEELGRSMAPVPHFVSCVISARVLLAAGLKTRSHLLRSRTPSPDSGMHIPGIDSTLQILPVHCRAFPADQAGTIPGVELKKGGAEFRNPHYPIE